ncbi:FecR domain-containing protein [Leptospira inadai]|nr:FecR domain-containing protein [Leptospira inadai]PNV74685.1 iron dicitrate transport regulator FecR [Leptospira inadai serovar Lyme]
MNFKPYVREIQVGSLCILVFLMSSYLLYFESKSRGDSGKEALGTVSFRYKTAQRKFPDRMLWEDVEQGMSVFNKDSVRTDEASEAVVHLNSGTQIELDPQSMVVLQLKENREILQLGEGSLLVQGKKVLSVITGKVGLDAKSDSSFQITNSPDGLSVNVRKGEVIWNEDGTARVTLGEGETALNAIKSEKKWNLILPEESYRFFPQEPEQLVEFRWEGGLDSVWEVSSKRDFGKIIEARTIKEKVLRQRFKEGIYFWRVRSQNRERISEVRKFRVLPNPAPDLFYPKKEGIQEERTVSFAWARQKIASGYRLQISSDPSFSNIRESQVFRTNFSMTLDPGTYYWRVVSYTNLPGTDAISETRKFAIVIPESPPAKEIQTPLKEQTQAPNNDELSLEFPKKGSVVDMTGKESLLFRWKFKPASKDADWKFRLYVRKVGKDELVYERKTKGDRFSFRDLEKLDVGVFLWTVESEENPSIKSEAEF